MDAAHGGVVAKLAGRLFDELRPEHGLTDRDRLLLEVAALLHDAGIHINRRSHHKHTHYILSSADIFGLSREDMAVVANVARYHRRGLPQKSHVAYMALDREDRVRVSKLAAILRVANALDADHVQRVRNLRIVREEDEWILEVEGGGDLTMERLALQARSDLFTEVFGQRLVFREAPPSAMNAPAKSRARTPELFLNRELSWLEFNGRVLEEAKDPGHPPLERLKFATIVASNLDEFFMVRVAGLRQKVRDGEVGADSAGLTPRQQLARIAERSRAMVEDLYATLEGEILPTLAGHGLALATPPLLDASAREYLSRLFREQVLPVLTPLAIDSSRPFPMLTSLSLNLAVLLEPAGEGAAPRLAVVQVPARLPRLFRVAGEGGDRHIPIEEVIRAELESLFPGQVILANAVFRVSRDSELDLDDEGGRDFLESIEEELRHRRRSDIVRLELERGADPALAAALARSAEVGDEETYAVPSPLDIRALGALLDLPALDALRDAPLKPLPSPALRPGEGLWDAIETQDILLHHPYDSFDPVVEFISQAAEDPDVLAIKQTLYRTSGDSPIVRALARAAERGKQVTVLVELLARFDEELNIRWVHELERAGAHVIYGIRGYKTHAKVLLVVRRTAGGIRRYVHLATGNYNDRTARIYTDFGLMTADAEVGADASAFFNALTGYSDPPRMSKLVMAPTRLRERFLDLIRREKRRAEAGQQAEIRAKMNALVDEEIIRALYEASGAGVRIRLNVRGICCLRPGLKGVSETIEVVSILDRFLEHARIFQFRNGGDEEVYLSSADWMPRNLDRRIELLFPVEAPACRRKVLRALDAMFQDTVKARVLQSDGTYRRRRPAKGQDPFRAQLELYRESELEVRRQREAAGVVFEPIRGSEPKA